MTTFTHITGLPPSKKKHSIRPIFASTRANLDPKRASFLCANTERIRPTKPSKATERPKVNRTQTIFAHHRRRHRISLNFAGFVVLGFWGRTVLPHQTSRNVTFNRWCTLEKVHSELTRTLVDDFLKPDVSILQKIV